MRYNVKGGHVSSALSEINDKFTTEHAQAMAKQVVDNAPVREGGLRGSITLSANVPVIEYGTKDKSGASTKSAIDSVELKVGDKAFITAGAPYALYVDQGTAKMAPTGFMRLAISDSQRLADETARKL